MECEAQVDKKNGSVLAKRKNTEALEKMRLKFVNKGSGWHLLVFVKDKKFNFWPGKGEWSDYGEFKDRKTDFFGHIKPILEAPVEEKKEEIDVLGDIVDEDRMLLERIVSEKRFNRGELQVQMEELQRRIIETDLQIEALERAINDLYTEDDE